VVTITVTCYIWAPSNDDHLIAQVWVETYNKGGEGSKKGRAEVIQTWVESLLTLTLLVWVCL